MNIHLKAIYTEKSDKYHCGDVSGEVPPVLIPNTVVKLFYAQTTYGKPLG